ncbi:MAG: hypothetical protein C5B49_04715 [Bdellovibrio sp.]|nr:MAG: hypothetical protein C5B49_04715 [Bdellovibrio sp.]
MKQSPKWQRGEHLEARLVEALSQQILLVEIAGQLYRVVNQTGHRWREGDPISLYVDSVEPLMLRISSGHGFERFA